MTRAMGTYGDVHSTDRTSVATPDLCIRRARRGRRSTGLERRTGFEPATPCLEDRNSTTELPPLKTTVTVYICGYRPTARTNWSPRPSTWGPPATWSIPSRRRSGRRGSGPTCAGATSRRPMSWGDLTVSYAERRVTLAGRPVPLTVKEYGTLAEPSANAGRVLTYERLLGRVWGLEGDSDGEVRRIRTVISSPRQKLGDAAENPTYIFTVLRVGYRMPKGEGPEQRVTVLTLPRSSAPASESTWKRQCTSSRGHGGTLLGASAQSNQYTFKCTPQPHRTRSTCVVATQEQDTRRRRNA